MPYEGELANKASHYDMVKNPEVEQFLKDCTYLKEPSDKEAEVIAARFEVPPESSEAELPNRVIAVDGSYYESSINDKLPSTRIGYVKVGCVLIDMEDYAALRVQDGRFVDPFKVAELQEGVSPLTFTLPSANIRSKGKKSVRDM